MGADTKIQFRPGPLQPLLDERAEPGTSPSAVAQRDLERYYQLLALALAQVQLSEAEASLIVDALNGTWVDINAAQLLAWEIKDALGDGLAEKWELDGMVLLQKLEALSLLQRMAVCDAVERFWGDTYHIEDRRARLLRVGLLRIPA